MWNWLRHWFNKAENIEDSSSDERVLSLEREVQSLRLEMTEREKNLADLRGDLKRQRSSERTDITRALEDQKERLFIELAAPVTQVLMQGHLLDVEGKVIQARDTLLVARRMVRVLEDHGLLLEGKIGEQVLFDPNHHEPLRTDASIAVGDAVIVRLMSVVFRGKVLRKAGVECVKG